MMDEVKMTLSIKPSPIDCAAAAALKWPLGTIVVMMLAINTQAN